MSNYKQILEKTAYDIEKTLILESDAVEIPTQNFGWTNKRFISDFFRIAHIERYSDKNLEVLHFTCFPNVNCQEPIFGFDTITTESKPLASFLDWSPVDNLTKMKNVENAFETEYKLPEWAKLIFSTSAIAIVPRETELNTICDTAINSLKDYINILKNARKSDDRTEYIVSRQNFYCDQQQKNQRTYNVLKFKIGEENARLFMDTILFPKVIVN